MKITIVGAGHGGTTIAADLKRKGHIVTLLKTSKGLHNEHFEYLKANQGEITIVDGIAENTVHLDAVTTNVETAITDAEMIIIYVQTNYHEQVIERILPFMNEDQIVLLEPGYLSTAYFLKHERNKNFTIVEAQSSPIDCRIIEPGKVKVLFKNVRNPVAIFTEKDKTIIEKKLDELQYNFIYLDSVIEAALHNPNLIVHTIGGIMSMPRIEYTEGDYWMYKEVFTPHVWNMVESLDKEKMDVLEKIGAKRIPYVDACRFRNFEDQTIDSKEAFITYAKNSSPEGPFVADSRFITEDVPEGLVLLESLGQMLDVETPTCTGLINIASAALTTDFRQDARTVELLGKENLEKIIGSLTISVG
ncbi:NAD/NADP octopine/nopaline dehydrogenase family protein [Sporosarcina sp. G11-34]|uniref:NAD/NADP octopine/nopaline dehydrogenase family protein n=1 Tax=Sporosarcina sp. G11-34 TaxID=2849605 RepID=UPI0022A9C0D2|nr:NAD/NADP octopine/nopaline dehydrogenase family protein [Sporosarcina sp. G11-34]MCZ2257377.1 NAD/NADP octopine/nopaline dehydrogenase family protein [Sporosarcina sp. G11-34]